MAWTTSKATTPTPSGPPFKRSWNRPIRNTAHTGIRSGRCTAQ
jgi:hypothetical protein